MTISYHEAETPLGRMTLGATDKGICFLGFGASGELLAALRREYPEAELDSAARPAFGGWVQAIAEHLQGGAPDLDLPLDVRATAFQTQVWDYLRAIPYGEVRSYAEVAAALGRPRAARAVARACASNHVAVAIPCHRVLRGTGELGGYKWGLARKRALLDLEKRAAGR